MREFIGRRIKDERDRQKLTQEELIESAQLSWDRQTLGQIENGEREIKAWELAQISRVLKLELASFFPASASEKKRPFVLWREKPKNHVQLEAKFIQLCNNYKFVEELNLVDKDSFRKLPEKKIDLNTVKYPEIYALAESVRSELDLGDYPAASFLKVLEEKYGVKFVFNDLDGNGSAAASCSDFGPCILISSTEPMWRQHFSIAHELFHVITWDEKILNQVIDSPEMWNKNESLANAFAGGFLVPTEALHKEIRLLSKAGKLNEAGLVAIARQFGVSLEALLWRMVGLFMIKPDAVKKILDDENLRAIDRNSHIEGYVSHHLSNRFVRLAYVAYESGEISRARLANILNQSLSGLPGYLRKFGLAEVGSNEISLSYT